MHWCNATNLSAQSLALVASSAFIKHVNAMSNSSPHDVSLNGFTQGHSKACFILSSTEGRCAPFSMASAMPSSAAAVEGLEEGDALDVSSLSLSLAFLREDMFLRSRPEWFRSSCSKSMGTLQNPLAFASSSKQKVCERSITLALPRRKHKRRRRRRER